jgi:hypothetical protein
MVINCSKSNFLLRRNKTRRKVFGYRKIWLGTSLACLNGCAAYDIDSDVVLETRVSARDSSRRVFQKSRLGSVSKTESLGSPAGGKSRDFN